jgi:hypothetical protein
VIKSDALKLLMAVALIAVCVAACTVTYYFGFALPRQHEAERKDEAAAKESRRVLEASRQCKEDGVKFALQFRRENTNVANDWWDDPQFHFSRKLNTCLVAVRSVKANSDFSHHYNEVWDIYSNRVVLYGHFRRLTPQGGPVTETVLDPTDENVPNYTSEKYFPERDKLFSQ